MATLLATAAPDRTRELHLRYALRLEAAVDLRILKVIRRSLKVAANRLALSSAVEPFSLDDVGTISGGWELGVAEEIIPLLSDIYQTSAGATAMSLTGEFGISDIARTASEHWAEVAQKRLAVFGQELQSKVQASLIEGMNLGEGIDPLQRRVRGVLDIEEPRASAIARTEAISASNAGSVTTAKAIGVDQKTWLATGDDRTRPTHRTADSQTVAIDELFSVGGWSGKYPGDPMLPADETINCRCTVTYGDAPSCFCTPAWAGATTAAAGEPDCQCSGTVTQDPAALEFNERLTNEQIRSLMPQPQWGPNLRKQTLEAMQKTDTGKVLADTLSRFQDGGSIARLRTAIDGRLSGKALAGATKRKVDSFVGVLRNAPTTDRVLYRGMSVKGQLKTVLNRYKSGETLDLNISSFSSDRGVAKRFQKLTGAPGKSRVMVELVGTKKAIPIQNITEDARLFKEREWVTAGRFRILEVKPSPDGSVILRITQEGTL